MFLIQLSKILPVFSISPNAFQYTYFTLFFIAQLKKANTITLYACKCYWFFIYTHFNKKSIIFTKKDTKRREYTRIFLQYAKIMFFWLICKINFKYLYKFTTN